MRYPVDFEGSNHWPIVRRADTVVELYAATHHGEMPEEFTPDEAEALAADLIRAAAVARSNAKAFADTAPIDVSDA